jgi:hypothetical protein
MWGAQLLNISEVAVLIAYGNKKKNNFSDLHKIGPLIQ